jgi:Arc/MetJ-type ribon-helix-helix transcriptional regulator
MTAISREIQDELARRTATGGYASVDELLRDALKALDDTNRAANALLERELLKGLEGKDVEMTPEEWDAIEREALETLKSKNAP